jgi:hypothetical protein
VSVTVAIQPANERRERFRQWFPRDLRESGPQSRGKRQKEGRSVDLGGVETAHRRQFSGRIRPRDSPDMTRL